MKKWYSEGTSYSNGDGVSQNRALSAAEAAGHRHFILPASMELHCSTSLSENSGFSMVARKPLLAIAKNAGTISRSNGFGISPWRRFATAAVDSEKLPLAGIRVLDMTRVLAGVCSTVSRISRVP